MYPMSVVTIDRAVPIVYETLNHQEVFRRVLGVMAEYKMPIERDGAFHQRLQQLAPHVHVPDDMWAEPSPPAPQD